MLEQINFARRAAPTLSRRRLLFVGAASLMTVVTATPVDAKGDDRKQQPRKPLPLMPYAAIVPALGVVALGSYVLVSHQRSRSTTRK